MNRTSKILNIFYCLTVILFLLDNLASFDIKNQLFKSIVYWCFLIGTPVMLFMNFFSIRTKVKRIIFIMYPTALLVLILVLNPIKILFSSSSWKTQTVLYQNGHLPFHKIEFHMQDLGALGYNKRTVKVLYLTSLFMLTSEVPEDIDNRIEWIKIENDVNELNLK